MPQKFPLNLRKGSREEPEVEEIDSSNNSRLILDPNMQRRVFRAWERKGNKPEGFIALYDADRKPIMGMHGRQAVISCFELPEMNNMNYENTHKKLFTDTEFYMPDPFIMMNFFTSVIRAQQGGKPLYHPDGNPVDKKLVEEMYKHLTTNYKNVYGRNDVGAWTWLNAGFPEVTIDRNNGTITGKIERVAGMNSEGLITNSRDLERCLIDDCYATLDINPQGLLVTKSQNTSYVAGQNLYSWYPRQGCVARFYANSDRAGLNCNWNPTHSNAGLGVFGCAEGAAQKK